LGGPKRPAVGPGAAFRAPTKGKWTPPPARGVAGSGQVVFSEGGLKEGKGEGGNKEGEGDKGLGFSEGWIRRKKKVPLNHKRGGPGGGGGRSRLGPSPGCAKGGESPRRPVRRDPWGLLGGGRVGGGISGRRGKGHRRKKGGHLRPVCPGFSGTFGSGGGVCGNGSWGPTGEAGPQK